MDYQLPPSPKTQINLAYPFQKLYTKTSYDCVTGTTDAVLHTLISGTHAGPVKDSSGTDADQVHTNTRRNCND